MAAAMKWTGKIVGGLLGMLTYGPVGAAIGVVLGHQFDAQPQDQGTSWRMGGTENLAAVGERFFRSTFRVMGYLAKADGRVSEKEISAARAVMSELRLDPNQIRAAIDYFNAGKQPGFDLQTELTNLYQVCARRPDLLRVFVELQVRAALAGNNMEGPVRSLIHRIASRLGISVLQVAQIEAVLRIRSGRYQYDTVRRDNEQEQLNQAYSVLEVQASASDSDIVRAYRRQLSRHHPDKLKANGLPESMIEHAKQRTQQIIEAYERIREQRKIS
jgi:DnaJ like chaperone protein